MLQVWILLVPRQVSYDPAPRERNPDGEYAEILQVEHSPNSRLTVPSAGPTRKSVKRYRHVYNNRVNTGTVTPITSRCGCCEGVGKLAACHTVG